MLGNAPLLQTPSQQLTLGPGSAPDATPEGVSTDLVQAVRLLCTTSGTCCTTDFCNTMSRIEMSFVAMFMSIAFALIGVFNGL